MTVVITTATVANNTAHMAIRREKCERIIQTQPETVEQKQEYASCVNLLLPTEPPQYPSLMWPLIFAVLITAVCCYRSREGITTLDVVVSAIVGFSIGALVWLCLGIYMIVNLPH